MYEKGLLLTLLNESGFLSKDKINQVLDISKEQKIEIFNVLLENNFVEEETLLQFLSEKLGIPFENVDRATVDFKIANLINEQFARSRNVLPLFQLGDMLTIAIANPFDYQTMEDLESMTGFDVNPILTLKDNINNLFGYCYSFKENQGDSSSQMADLYEMGLRLIGDSSGEEVTYDLAQEAPIAKLVDTIIKQAIEEKASDIHIEPEEKCVKIRFRIDGLLKDVMNPPKKLESAIISRMKILSNLDITEKRKPQDGRMTIAFKDKDIDFRVSTVRTISGEKIVLRVLDKSGSFVSIDKLGLSYSDVKKFSSMIDSASGIVLVCGPTGSGKTSTLYSALAKINTPEKNIITIEDPVEYNLEGINQIPVNAKIGMSFASGLSAIVRQDPDVIMVGEIRDFETATISIQAALTGHMVFSTIHTRNAPGALTRLIDMGIAPFLLTSAINGIIAQRLVRTICPNCKKEIAVRNKSGYKEMELIKELTVINPDFKLYMGEGCKFCDDSGYKGRTGIYEIMTMNDEIRSLTVQKASTEVIFEAAVRAGMVSLRADGLMKVAMGDTSIEEIARVLDI